MTNDLSADSQSSGQQARVATVLVTVLLCLYWLALFYGTHTSLPPGMLPGNSDKIIHCGAYGGLGVLLMTLRATRGAFPWFSVIARWFVLAGYGAFDELTQMLVGRTADVNDWLADLVGAALGLGLVTMIYWRIRRPKKAVDPA